MRCEFASLPRDERADIIRDLAAAGMSRKQIAEHVNAPNGSIDTICNAYGIKTVHPRIPPGDAHVIHPGWDYEPDKMRKWFQAMDRRFVEAMGAARQLQ